MSVSSLSDLSRQHMLNMLGPQLTKAKAQVAKMSGDGSGSTDPTQLSPFAQMLTGLQQLQNTSPAQYSKVTQQLSTNLSNAATAAQNKGNTALASELTTLSKDFSMASQNGELPNMSDLETAFHAGNQTQKNATLPNAGSLSGATAKSSNPLQMLGGMIGKIAGI